MRSIPSWYHSFSLLYLKYSLFVCLYIYSHLHFWQSRLVNESLRNKFIAFIIIKTFKMYFIYLQLLIRVQNLDMRSILTTRTPSMWSSGLLPRTCWWVYWGDTYSCTRKQMLKRAMSSPSLIQISQWVLVLFQFAWLDL